MITTWLTGLDRIISGLAPSWLLSLALVTVAALLVLIAARGRPSLKSSALAWVVAP